MTTRSSESQTAAGALKHAFDASFAVQPAAGVVAEVDVLAIRVAAHGYALRLSEVLAMHAERQLTPVPSPVAALRGLVGVRGLVAPVYDLRLLLGYDAGPSPRWLLLARAASPIGFAFEAFEAHWRVPLSSVVAGAAGEGQARGFACGSVETAAGPRPLLHLPSLIESVTKQLRPNSERAREERR